MKQLRVRFTELSSALAESAVPRAVSRAWDALAAASLAILAHIIHTYHITRTLSCTPFGDVIVANVDLVRSTAFPNGSHARDAPTSRIDRASDGVTPFSACSVTTNVRSFSVLIWLSFSQGSSNGFTRPG